MKARPSHIASTDPVPRVARTLLTNGYWVDAFERPADGAFLFQVRRRDVLGGEARTVLLFARTAGTALLLRLTKTAEHYRGAAVAVMLGVPFRAPPSVLRLPELEFYTRLGGEVRTDRIFVARLPALMHALGHGRVPPPLRGDADTLLEEYVQDCWSYLLDCPVRRYGQDRSFERLPDGLLLGRDRFNVNFDAKAYRKGFHPSSQDMRAFEEYVRDFNSRYEPLVGRISVFVVVSGSFRKSTSSLAARANELLTRVGTPLVFMTAKEVANAVELVRPLAHRRKGLNWSHILVPPIFDPTLLQRELRRVGRDAVG